jgi:hypothetical protein
MLSIQLQVNFQISMNSTFESRALLKAFGLKHFLPPELECHQPVRQCQQNIELQNFYILVYGRVQRTMHNACRPAAQAQCRVNPHSMTPQLSDMWTWASASSMWGGLRSYIGGQKLLQHQSSGCTALHSTALLPISATEHPSKLATFAGNQIPQVHCHHRDYM